MLSRHCNRRLASVLIAGQFVFLAQMPLAQAAMIGTPQAMQEQTQQQHQPVDQAQLRAMLDDKQVQQKLESLGVPREQVEARIASLTPAELQQFNQRLEQEPAGGWVGIIVLFLVIFIITDMLCATDIFSFIKCIN
ncbi:PA2779 family protein [Pseudomonas sp. JM0905a]|uniref:PA2779 family protein n=1 Tax=Metapseudomonas resinovorans TaxID=53412 RepID=A0ABT4Y118_METRE|nr:MULTISPECIES: PA2779 family protein [Pseudomonas]MBD2838010.1 PA2779 family protein [Pseudomonas sp. JM0905a]MDA8482496.1 PA2779 family protein [Pseudomonas resinovorans]